MCRRSCASRRFAKASARYAIVLACSDSRVIPEAIFSAGIGDLFVIRVAGNVVDKHQLGSIEYAEDHLGCNLVVVLGHTGCGAVDAAMHHEPYGTVKFITDEIADAIGDETDEAAALPWPTWRTACDASRKAVKSEPTKPNTACG